MQKYLAALLTTALALVPWPVLAEVTAPAGMTSNAANSVLPDALNNLGTAQVLTPQQYGAIADGLPHALSTRFATLAAAQAVCPEATALTQEVDWCAINAALKAIRDTPNAASGLYDKSLFFANGTYYVTDPINLTCFSDATGTNGCTNSNRGHLIVYGNNATILCATNGKPCLYGMGSRFVGVNDLTLVSAAALPGSVGVQIGRTDAVLGADTWNFSNVRTRGCWTVAGHYNLAAEVVSYRNVDFWSLCTSGTPSNSAGPYAVILDGGNHWDLPAYYGVVQGVAVNTATTFNDLLFSGGTIQSGGTGFNASALWIYGTRGLKFDNTYLNTSDGKCIRLYIDGSSENSRPNGLDARMHCEGPTLTSYFYITTNSGAPQVNPIIHNLSLADPALFAQQVFTRDTVAGVSTVKLDGSSRIVLPNVATGTPALFDAGASYSVSNPEDIRVSTSITGYYGITVGGAVCTGIGTTGTCTAPVFSSPVRGYVVLTPGGTGIVANGAVDIVFPFNVYTNLPICVGTPSYGGGAWDDRATVVHTANAPNAARFRWSNNAVNLTSGSTYRIHYTCWAS